MGRKGETTSYAPMSFEEFYTRKLEALKVQLKDIIYGGLPFVTSWEYACKKCAGRIKIHADGRMTCMTCEPLPANWSKQQRECVYEILRNYPDVDECAKEWSPPKKEPSRVTTTEAVAFGARVEEARQAHGWTQEELASMIVKPNGQTFSRATIKAIELGAQGSSQYLKEELKRVLGLKERVQVCLEV